MGKRYASGAVDSKASMKAGCHISIRRGYRQAAETALSIGAEAFQYFPKNPRSLALKTSFDRKDAEACAAFCAERGLVSIGHTPYPINLAYPASPDRAAVVAALRNCLEIAEACGSIGIVVHFGKSKDTDPLQGYRNIIETINKTLEDWQGRTLFLLENQAGDGSPMGTTLEELVQIRKLAERPDRIGFCLDTCHLFASGTWRTEETAALLQRAKELEFLPHLKAVHLNDSRYGQGSCKDRHANVGRGYIGEEAFRTLLRGLPQAEGLPLVLETEAGPDGTHRAEVALVKSLLPD